MKLSHYTALACLILATIFYYSKELPSSRTVLSPDASLNSRTHFLFTLIPLLIAMAPRELIIFHGTSYGGGVAFPAFEQNQQAQKPVLVQKTRMWTVFG